VEIAYETTINPIGLTFVVIMGFMLLFIPARYVVLPIFLTCSYITIGQQVLVGPFHFSVLRIIIIIGWVRIFTRRDFPPIGFNAIDKMLLVWALSGALINVLLLNNGSEEAIINRMGFLYDLLGLYFFFRIYVGTFQDVEDIIRFMSVSIVPLAVIMILEKVTGRNFFFIFGGVPEMSWIRDGIVRAQGPFRNPIIAGTFGATLMPLFAGLWWQEERGHFFAVTGVVSAIVIVIMAHSGGPFSAFMFGVIAFAFWRFQQYIKPVLIGLVLLFVYAHIFMKPPVWYLMMRLSSFVGGGGWHRAYIIDQAIIHIDEWWLYGTNYTAHWMPYALAIDPNHSDITNQFLVEGVRGGLLTMFLFMMLIIVCFRGIKNAFMASTELPLQNRMLLWSIGAALVTHVITFTSVSYFDQMIAVWYLMLAILSWASNLPDDLEYLEPETA